MGLPTRGASHSTGEASNFASWNCVKLNKHQSDIIIDIILLHYGHTRCVPASEAVAVKEPLLPESLPPGVQVQQRRRVVGGDWAPGLDSYTGTTLKCGACNTK